MARPNESPRPHVCLSLMKLSFALTTALFCAAFTLVAADAPKPAKPAYLTEAEARAAGPDYELQGEYADAGLGAQVIALGDSKFRLVLHPGGLPGASLRGVVKPVSHVCPSGPSRTWPMLTSPWASRL